MISELLEQAQNHYQNNNHKEAFILATEALCKSSLTFEEEIKLLEIVSISAFYANEKDAGKRACEMLATDKKIPWETRNLARQNSTYYARGAVDIMPSTRFTHFDINFGQKWNAMNPSISNFHNELWMIQRTVNYQITDSGHYDMKGDTAIRTNNYLMRLDNELKVLASKLISMPVDLPLPEYDQVRGFEDSRLFFLNGTPWCTSTVRELNKEGYCEIAIAKIIEDGVQYRLSDYRVIHPQFGERTHQKNWMPVVTTMDRPPFSPDRVDFLYSSDPVRLITDHGHISSEIETNVAADSFRGGSQLIEFNDGWLGIIHESHNMPNHKRNYMHRFVFYKEGKLIKYTEAFYFRQLGIEFAAGIAKNHTTNEIIISFGLADKESWLASFNQDEIFKCLK